MARRRDLVAAIAWLGCFALLCSLVVATTPPSSLAGLSAASTRDCVAGATSPLDCLRIRSVTSVDLLASDCHLLWGSQHRHDNSSTLFRRWIFLGGDAEGEERSAAQTHDGKGRSSAPLAYTLTLLQSAILGWEFTADQAAGFQHLIGYLILWHTANLIIPWPALVTFVISMIKITKWSQAMEDFVNQVLPALIISMCGRTGLSRRRGAMGHACRSRKRKAGHRRFTGRFTAEIHRNADTCTQNILPGKDCP